MKQAQSNIRAHAAAPVGHFIIFIGLNTFLNCLDAHITKLRLNLFQGLDIVDVCKEAGVKHIVMSSLESCIDLSGIAVAHFDSKAIVEEHIKVLEINAYFLYLLTSDIENCSVLI